MFHDLFLFSKIANAFWRARRLSLKPSNVSVKFNNNIDKRYDNFHIYLARFHEAPLRQVILVESLIYKCFFSCNWRSTRLNDYRFNIWVLKSDISLRRLCKMTFPSPFEDTENGKTKTLDSGKNISLTINSFFLIWSWYAMLKKFE